VEAETCSDTVINNNTNKNLVVAIAGILSERFLCVCVLCFGYVLMKHNALNRNKVSIH
jgi:hypothetical protein